MTGQTNPRGTNLFNRLLGFEARPEVTRPATIQAEWGSVTEVELYDALVKISIQEVKDYPYMTPEYNKSLDVSSGKGKWRYVCFNLSITTGDTTRVVAGYHIERNKITTLQSAIDIVMLTLYVGDVARTSYEQDLKARNVQDSVHARKRYYFAQKCRDFWAIYDPKAPGADRVSDEILSKLRAMRLSEQA